MEKLEEDCAEAARPRRSKNSLDEAATTDEDMFHTAQQLQV